MQRKVFIVEPRATGSVWDSESATQNRELRAYGHSLIRGASSRSANPECLRPSSHIWLALAASSFPSLDICT